MITERTVNTSTVTINYAEGPEAGAPLILLHGGSGRWQGFDAILPELTERWHVYAPDLRGHGRAGWTPGLYRLQDYADDIIALLERCINEPAYLFGHSMGGMVALLVAARRPERVRAVIVGDAPLTAPAWRNVLERDRDALVTWRDLAGGTRPLDEVIETLKNAPMQQTANSKPVPMRVVFGEDAPVFPWLATNLSQHDPNVLTTLLDHFDVAASGYDMDVVLPQVKCSVLLLQAEPQTGGLLTDAEIKRAMDLLPKQTHIKLANISHVLFNEQKDPVLDAITAFLDAH